MTIATSCAILAGGSGLRLGGVAKGLIEQEGEPLIGRLVRLVAPLCREVMVIANDPRLYGFLNVPIYPDDTPGRGPLEGIATGLRRSGCERVLVVACDMPFITAEAVRTMIDWKAGADAVVPRSEKGYEPLFALYAQSSLPVIEAQLIQGKRKVSSVFPLLRIETPPVEMFDASLWYNINEPCGLEKGFGSDG
jgi:molybdopterin-guanine dinucleotide biosynthesis protein A